MNLCVCGHRRAVAHPLSGPCFDSVGPVDWKSKRCPCKKFRPAAGAVNGKPTAG